MIAFLQRCIFHNFALKVMSLLLAAAMWLIIARDEQPAEVAVHAPIVFEHVPADLEVSSESVPEALIRVRGPERLIRQLRVNEVQAEIDLSGSTPHDRTFELTSQQVRHPRELAVVQVVPSQIHLSFDTRLSREVPVNPRVAGIFASGEQIVRVVADPPRITVTGPSHHVERIDAATTDPIDATGTRGSAVFSSNVYVSDPLVQVEGTTSIRVTVVVQKIGTATSH